VWHDAAVTEVVDRWHGDRIAVKYAHKGGSCGCRYLADLALRTVLGAPVQVSDDGEPV
jgi:hypothetical protein